MRSEFLVAKPLQMDSMFVSRVADHPYVRPISEREMHVRHPVRVSFSGHRYRPAVHEDSLHGTSVFVSGGGARLVQASGGDSVAAALEIGEIPELKAVVGRVVTLFVEAGPRDFRTAKALVLKPATSDRARPVCHLVLRPPADDATSCWADMD